MDFYSAIPMYLSEGKIPIEPINSVRIREDIHVLYVRMYERGLL